MDRKKPPKSSKPQPQAVADSLYAKSARQVLKELTELLSGLGISAKFRLTRIKANTLSKKSRGYKNSYASVIGEVLSSWHREPSFLDKSGNPKALRKSGSGPSFQSLVSIALPRAPVKQVLETLIATQSVYVDTNGFVIPLRRTIPVFSDKDLAKLHTFIALRGFVRTLRHNLHSRALSSDQLFHRIAWNGEFNKNEIGRLKIWINKHGQSFLESIDDWMKTHSIRRRKTTKDAARAVKASIGIYLSVEPE